MIQELTEREKSLKLLTRQRNSSVIVDYLPEPHVPVIVHCRQYDCLAYLDSKGIWRNNFAGTPVDSQVLAWSQF